MLNSTPTYTESWFSILQKPLWQLLKLQVFWNMAPLDYVGIVLNCHLCLSTCSVSFKGVFTKSTGTSYCVQALIHDTPSSQTCNYSAVDDVVEALGDLSWAAYLKPALWNMSEIFCIDCNVYFIHILQNIWRTEADPKCFKDGHNIIRDFLKTHYQYTWKACFLTLTNY